jgi:N-acetyltransferase
MEWSKEEEREGYGTSITEVRSRIKLGNGRTGRIISFPADVGGKIGCKVCYISPTAYFGYDQQSC